MKKPKFLQDRYGFDLLFFAVTALCLVIALFAKFVLVNIPHISVGGIMSALGLTMIINFSRVLSKDKQKRSYENIKFKLRLNKILHKPKSNKPDHIEVPTLGPMEYRCSCGRKLDVPSQSGQQIVLCPTCGKRNIIKVK